MLRPLVIKYGGSLLEDPEHRVAFLKDVAVLARKEKVALVHGGGKEITRALEASGLPTRFVQGRRYTDRAAMKVVEQVLSAINTELVGILKSQGINAVGLSGKSNQLMVARPLSDLGRVGQPDVVNQTRLKKMLGKIKLPVFFSVAMDSDGESLNINADDFALSLAVTCGAKRLVFLTDAGAVLDSQGQPLKIISASEVPELIGRHVITGGMIVKARACAEALRRGVGRVDICKGIQSLLSPDVPMQGTSFVHDAMEQN